MNSPEEAIKKIKEKAIEFAKKHAANNAKAFYVLGKQDAASMFLAMIREDGYQSTIQDIAKELLRHNPNHENAKWAIDTFSHESSQ